MAKTKIDITKFSADSVIFKDFEPGKAKNETVISFYTSQVRYNIGTPDKPTEIPLSLDFMKLKTPSGIAHFPPKEEGDRDSYRIRFLLDPKIPEQNTIALELIKLRENAIDHIVKNAEKVNLHLDTRKRPRTVEDIRKTADDALPLLVKEPRNAVGVLIEDQPYFLGAALFDWPPKDGKRGSRSAFIAAGSGEIIPWEGLHDAEFEGEPTVKLTKIHVGKLWGFKFNMNPCVVTSEPKPASALAERIEYAKNFQGGEGLSNSIMASVNKLALGRKHNIATEVIAPPEETKKEDDDVKSKISKMRKEEKEDTTIKAKISKLKKENTKHSKVIEKSDDESEKSDDKI